MSAGSFFVRPCCLTCRPVQHSRLPGGSRQGALRHGVVRCRYATGDIIVLVLVVWPAPHEQGLCTLRRRTRRPSLANTSKAKRTNAILGEKPVCFGAQHERRVLGCTFWLASFCQTKPQQSGVASAGHVDGALAAPQTSATPNGCADQCSCKQQPSQASNLRVLDAYCG